MCLLESGGLHILGVLSVAEMKSLVYKQKNLTKDLMGDEM
jgi:hypothetical protein